MNRSWHRRATGGLPILSATLLSVASLMCDGALSSAAAQANAGASNDVIVNYDVLNTLPSQQAPAGAPPITLKRPGVAQSAEPTAEANGSQIATATPPAGPVEMPTSVTMPEPTPPPPAAAAAAPAPAAPAAPAPAAAAVETPAPAAEPAPAAQAAVATPATPAPEQSSQPQVEEQPVQQQAVQETPPAEVQPVPQAQPETPPVEEQPTQQQAATQEQPAETPAPEPSAQEQAAQQQAAQTSPEETPPAETPPEETPPAETPAPTEPPAEGQAPAETEQQPADAAAEPAAEPDNSQPAAPVPQGGIRIVFPTEMNDVPPEANAALDDLASQMQADESMRIQIKCYASGTVDTESKARRRALARCINIRQYLYQKNIRTTRIDVRALGLKSEGQPADRVDIVPANS